MLVDATFTKVDGGRYTMEVTGAKDPELGPRQGAGYDEFLPHDVVHFIVEDEAGLAGGVFGRVADGQSNLFPPAEAGDGRRHRRRVARHQLSKSDHKDMARSELLASVCPPLWELRTGRRSQEPEWFGSVDPEVLDSPLIDRVLCRLDDFAERWSVLPVGGSITLDWLVSPRR
ncbi:MAG: hypothetical protein ACR2G7_02735 [Acidimicrobiales bacterium]